MATKTALVFMGTGSEEIECVVALSVLRRAKFEVTLVGLDSNVITGSQNINIKPDKTVDDVKGVLFDAVVIPGGIKGAGNLAKSAEVGEILKAHYKIGNIIAAICAGPTVLAAHGIGKGKRITSYPSDEVKNKLHDYTYTDTRVERDGNIITGRAPGAAFEWIYLVVGAIKGQALVDEMKGYLYNI